MQHQCKVTVLETTCSKALQEETAWLASQDFTNTADEVYTG